MLFSTKGVNLHSPDLLPIQIIGGIQIVQLELLVREFLTNRSDINIHWEQYSELSGRVYNVNAIEV